MGQEEDIYADPPEPGSASASRIGGPERGAALEHEEDLQRSLEQMIERGPVRIDARAEQHRINIESIPAALAALDVERAEARVALRSARDQGFSIFILKQRERLARLDRIYHCLRRFQREFIEAPEADKPVNWSLADAGEHLIQQHQNTAKKIFEDIETLFQAVKPPVDLRIAVSRVRDKYLSSIDHRAEEEPMAYTPKKTVITKKRHEFEVKREHGAPIEVRMMEDAIRVATRALVEAKGEKAAEYDDALCFEPRDESIVIYFETEE